MRSRLTLLVALLATVGLLAGCGAFGDAPERAPDAPLRIGLPTGVTSFANADLAVAVEKGFLAEAGLTVETENLRSGVSVVQGVVGGALDIGASSIEPVVNAASGGGDVVVIGAYTDRLTVSAVAPVDVRNPADLRGKRVGVQEVGAFREVMSRLVLESGGLTPDDVEYVPVDGQSYTAALVDKRIQSGILQTEQAVAAEQDHPDLHVLADLADIVPDYHYGTYFVTRDWLEDHPEDAKRFLTAITRAHRFMYENRAETVRIVAAATEFPEPVVNTAYESLLVEQGVFPVNSGLDRKRIESTVERMRGLGILDRDPPPYDQLVNTRPVDATVAELGPLTGDQRWR